MLKRLALMLFVAWSHGAAAHGTADNHLQIMLVDERVKLNITVDMRLLGVVDANKDGFASLDEMARRRALLDAYLVHLLGVTDQDGDEGTLAFADVVADLDVAQENGGRVDHARVIRTLAFDGRPEALRLDFAKLVEAVPNLRVTMIDAASGMKFRLRDPSQRQQVTLPGP
ncbi:MAG: hypothetical protein AAFN78_19145 [Pseudomonadota bacterium]